MATSNYTRTLDLPTRDRKTSSDVKEGYQPTYKPADLSVVYRDFNEIQGRFKDNFKYRVLFREWLGKGSYRRDIQDLFAHAGTVAWAKFYESFHNNFKNDKEKLYQNEGKNRLKMKKTIIDWFVEFVKSIYRPMYDTLTKDFKYSENMSDEGKINELYTAVTTYMNEFFDKDNDKDNGARIVGAINSSVSGNALFGDTTRSVGHYLELMTGALGNLERIGKAGYFKVTQKAAQVAHAGTHSLDWLDYALGVADAEGLEVDTYGNLHKDPIAAYEQVMALSRGDAHDKDFDAVGLKKKEVKMDRGREPRYMRGGDLESRVARS